MSVAILSVTLVGTLHGGDRLGVARCTLRRGSRPSGRRPDPLVLAAESVVTRLSVVNTGYEAVDERAGRGAQLPDGRAF